MTETKIEATCETCPWWVEVEGMVADGEAGDWRQCGECRNGQSEAFRTEPECDFWCSEHPDRTLPDPTLQRIAAALEMIVGRMPTRRERIADDVLAAIADSVPHPDEREFHAGIAYDYADAMLAEAKRRRGE